jgi:probable phosphoglycerate mutase
MTGLADTTIAAADPGGLRALVAAASAFRLHPGVDGFLFLRHGRTAGNIGRVYQHPDDPLAPEGFADADRAAQILARRDFAQIAASDMARAWLTSGRVAAATGKPVVAAPSLRERFFGDLIGTPSVGLDWRADPPNGETLGAFVARAADGVNSALARGPGEMLLVSHGGVLQVVAGMLGVALAPDLTRNALPLTFRRTGDAWMVEPLA